MNKKILLMYISEHSGHHQAARAVENAILIKSPGSAVLSINAFRYVNPVLERIIHSAYMKIIRRRPEIWEYLYDNPEVMRKTKWLKDFLNNSNSRKITRLIKEFEPNIIACTQAFPCGIVASYKKLNKKDTPLVGILTDYAPHSYWIYDDVDVYVVPSKEVGDALIKKGVSREKIKALGVPIDPAFAANVEKRHISEKLGIKAGEKTVLVMGGTHGIGPDEKLLSALAASRKEFAVIIITGVNKQLFEKAKAVVCHSEKKMVALGFVNNVEEIMAISQVIITKPGGLTTAEAMARTLPMIILNPLPGQEDFNAKVLIEKGMALKAGGELDAVGLLEDLLGNTEKLGNMQKAMAENAKPNSASDIASLLLSPVRSKAPGVPAAPSVRTSNGVNLN